MSVLSLCVHINVYACECMTVSALKETSRVSMASAVSERANLGIRTDLSQGKWLLDIISKTAGRSAIIWIDGDSLEWVRRQHTQHSPLWSWDITSLLCDCSFALSCRLSGHFAERMADMRQPASCTVTHAVMVSLLKEANQLLSLWISLSCCFPEIV